MHQELSLNAPKQQHKIDEFVNGIKHYIIPNQLIGVIQAAIEAIVYNAYLQGRVDQKRGVLLNEAPSQENNPQESEG